MKKIVLLIMLSISTFSFSQYDEWVPGEVILKSNDTLKGLVYINSYSGATILFRSNVVRFKKTKKSKTKVFKHKVVNKMLAKKDTNVVSVFEYINYNGKKILLQKRSDKGIIKFYSRKCFGGKDPGSDAWYYKHYFLIRKGEEGLTKIRDNQFINSSKSIKPSLKKYFKDCPKLVEKFMKKYFKTGNISTNIIQVLNDYIKICNSSD